jgi:hypothetical protein
MFVTGAWRRVHLRRYHGSASDICEQVVRGCFDAKQQYFRTSIDTYRQMWARDFGRAAPALIEIGFADEVEQTFRFALDAYARAGRFALVIDPRGRLYDFPPACHSPDGLAYFLSGLAAVNNPSLVRRYSALLQSEIARFVREVVDPATGLLLRGLHVSEAQDYTVRDCSCYSCCMLHLMSCSVDALGLSNPLAGFDYTQLVPQAFFRDGQFLDALGSSGAYVSADACLAPFSTGLLGWGDEAAARFGAVLSQLDDEHLNDPLPTRYGRGAHPERKMLALERVNGWQTDAVWTCLGLEALEVMRRLDKPRYQRELLAYTRMVERLGCFLEVLDARTTDLLRTPLYVSETAMLWAGSLLAQLRREGP